MKPGFTINEIKKATGAGCAGTEAARLLPGHVTGVSMDSRTLRPGELFVALRGAKHDGHDFVEACLEKGAAAALVSAEWASSRRAEELARPLLSVRDTLCAFQELGKYNRIRVNPKVVAVTGSNGKTTTKEMIAAVSSSIYRTAKTQGNLNNQFGVPITLLQLQHGDEVAVVEMGMNSPGEIRQLASLCLPSIGVITNASAAHLEGMGTVEEVARAKTELAEELDRDDWLVIHRDSEELFRLNRYRQTRLISFGFSGEADVFPAEVKYGGTEGTEIQVEGFPRVRTSLLGKQNVLNALAALATSRALGVPPDKAAAALAVVKPAAGRMEMKSVGPAYFIDDTYNANPVSMRLALETLAALGGFERRIAVLGDMLELGETSERWHFELGKDAEVADLLILCGQFAGAVKRGAESGGKNPDAILVMGSHSEIAEYITSTWKRNDLFLVKGSRGAAMEKVIQEVEQTMRQSPDARAQSVNRGA